MIKITKKQLLDDICEDFHDTIRENWPKYRKKISPVELVKIARGVEISEFDMQWVLWFYDFPNWNVAQVGVSNEGEAGSKIIVDNYLNEHLERD